MGFIVIQWLYVVIHQQKGDFASFFCPTFCLNRRRNKEHLVTCSLPGDLKAADQIHGRKLRIPMVPSLAKNGWENHHFLSMGKSTISTGPCYQCRFLNVYQRVITFSQILPMTPMGFFDVHISSFKAIWIFRCWWCADLPIEQIWRWWFSLRHATVFGRISGGHCHKDVPPEKHHWVTILADPRSTWI